MALSWIEMPDGYVFALDNIKSISVVGLALRLTSSSGGVFDWPANDAGYASFLKGQIKTVQTTPANYTVLNPLYISSISPTAFNMASATITINGSGFSAASIGKIYLDDVGGGQDFNGYQMQCTYVSANQMTAVFSSSGDGIIGGAGVMIAYKDSNGVISNTISGTNPSSTNITIP